ncbi:PREDICTED: dolichyl-diphosphooligosaccharide--protein glycosyltransferase subunit STT3A [Propithecus coquereli]|uniref:dolichyl-diphosphooligosaccharide--protein glycosyltransferase subunit STT3A n=1 Tax=Propithecus coquereli TaxID=379532 RepID=UPI00063F3ECA|nr:PREDICTED: dolichyl-diphosphooligosaccharide--protein glycosyltransferase subunit STT3A [Propithecus coquereli]
MTKLGFLRLSYEKQDTLLKLLILSMAAVLSFSTRLFAVLRFESVIHEFDPYFNYRTTRFLAEEGFYKFHNWFDDRAWYPLGRIIGGTIYPGLMITSAAIYHVLHFFHITIDIRNVCVFLAPLFSSFTTIVTYHLTKELKDAGAGLLAAAMIAVVPGYISRSVAGSYDNEGIAIFCMLLTYYMWIKAVKTGSIYWAAKCALAYFYMVRLMLVLAPVMCILSGIGVSQVLSTYMKNLDISRPDKKSKKQQDSTYPIKNEVASGMILVMAFFLITYTFHSTWVTSEAYSSPSIVLSARGGDGSRIIFDDFREAYYWLRHNTPEDAKVMSWWDYGYQITAMANRTILVDNNTWNNTHISRVGQAMASTEEKAYEIMRELDVSYVLVIFGGLTGYSSDDINKFLWMVRIGGSTDTGKHIKENDYYTPTGEFRVDREGSPVLLNCLMYKMCYYRFGQVYTEAKRPPGFDRVRNAEIGNKDFELDVLEEAYTTEHWLVRIYKVKDLDNRGLSRT